MVDYKIISIISFILNIIFVFLLFFKSALNDILKEWWFDRKKKKEKTIERIIDFKTKFNLEQSQSFLVIVTLAQKQLGLIMRKPVDQFIEDIYQNSLRTSSEAQIAISKFLDYLPATLINHYMRYEEQFTETIKKIMEDNIGKEDVMAYSEKLTSLVLEITNFADSILREKLD